MVTVVPFILDPTLEETQKMDSLKLKKYIVLESSNPKDQSLVKMAQGSKSKVLAFIIEKFNNEYGNSFGFGDSEDDFVGYFPSIDDFKLFWNKANGLDSLSQKVKNEDA